MRIDVIGDDSISRQARTYGEYRLFAALSAVVDTRRVRSASLVLRHTKSRRHCKAVLCTVTVELNGGEVARLRASGDHPYAAINRAVERVRSNVQQVRHDSSPPEMVATESGPRALMPRSLPRPVLRALRDRPPTSSSESVE
jgi:ribosome-associated translation inhibitor RaiA